MSKKTRNLMCVILAVIFALGVGCYIIIFTYKLYEKNMSLITYPTIQITQEVVDKINSGEILKDSSEFNDMWKVPSAKNGEYGELVEVVYRFNIKRHVKFNDYIVEKTVDFSQLDSDNNIFFAKSTGLSGEKVFACSGDELTAPTYVALWGCTYGKTEKEIEEIAEKIKIVFFIQHPNGKVDKKQMGVNDIEVKVSKADENDIDCAKGFLQINEGL